MIFCNVMAVAFVADFGIQNFNFKTNFDMGNNTLIN